MDKPLPKGTQVRQVVPVIEGVISDVSFDSDKLAFNYKVDYTDANGDSHSRWFAQSEVAEKVKKEDAQ